MTWSCASCETVNAADAERCVVCDTTRAASARAAAARAAAITRPKTAPPPADADPASGGAAPAPSPPEAVAPRPSRRRLRTALAALLVVAVVAGLLVSHPHLGSTAGPTADARAARSASATPAAVLRAHYEHLDAGEYAAAFQLMTRRYRREVKDWVAIRAHGASRIQLLKLGPTRTHGGSARVFVRFAAHDTVGDTTCRHFGGWAHMVREHGRWRYDPIATHYAKRTVPGGCG